MNANDRPLTELEKLFIKEAEKGCFGAAIDDNGAPFALGAPGTGNLFSMDVIENDDPYNKGSIYTLRGE